MQIRTKIILNYTVLTVITLILVSTVVFVLVKKNKQQYFISRLEDRAQIVAQAYVQDNMATAEADVENLTDYLEKLPMERDFVLQANSKAGKVEFSAEIDVPHMFFRNLLIDGRHYQNSGYQFYYGQLFTVGNLEFVVIVSAMDEVGAARMNYLRNVLILCVFGAMLLAFILGAVLAQRVVKPIADITREANRISVSNLHNRLPETEGGDELAALKRTFNNMLDRLETSFEIQSNFINNASHELRTPITAIMAETEITLEKERNKEDYVEAIQGIYKQANKLASLIESLLKLTQTGYDGEKQVLDQTRMDELLMEIKSDVDKRFSDTKVSINLDQIPEDDSWITVSCNRPLLQLALMNIITNAVKYSDNREVFVSLTASQALMQITITDLGIGIPKDEIPLLFEPFFRGRNTTRHVGYGLGLPLAQKIIKMHGGNIQVLSEEGKGTVVSVKFKTLK